MLDLFYATPIKVKKAVKLIMGYWIFQLHTYFLEWTFNTKIYTITGIYRPFCKGGINLVIFRR